MKNNKHLVNIFLVLFSLAAFATGCEKFVEVDPPKTSTGSKLVFNNDASAVSAVTAVLMKLASSGIYPGDEVTSATGAGGLSSDELKLNNLALDAYRPFYKADLTPDTYTSWSNIYTQIFNVNAAIEGITASKGLLAITKQRLLGEAKFLRGFFYFYLVNFYGEVPLVLTTDYKVNMMLPRAAVKDVYDQIINDFKDAQNFLSDNYLSVDMQTTTPERVRPNKWAATAMLARSYLYNKDYMNAEIQATSVIDNKTLYDTVPLNKIFLINSREAIWQFPSLNVGTAANSIDGRSFLLTPTTNELYGPYFDLTPSLLNSFESNDQRRANWVSSATDATGTAHIFPFKYKIGYEDVPPTEASTILRLGEQYLIRAEARAQLEKLTDAQRDLNVIRTRAGLPNTTANDKTALLSAVLQERRVELFSEWGHRFLDLKRFGVADAVLSIEKGSNWQTTDQLYPLPQREIDRGINLKQNPGY